MSGKEAHATEAVDDLIFIHGERQKIFKRIFRKMKWKPERLRKAVKAMNPGSWLDNLLDDFEIDMEEFRH